MPEEPLFDHLSIPSRRFHEFHRKWSVESFHIQLAAMSILALESVRQGRAKDAYWQAQAAYRFAREIERQAMEFTQRIPA